MTTIKLRRGTAAEWTSANPILAAGEMGIETDTRKFKFGDGTTPWNTLAYASAEGGGGGTGDVTAAGDNYFTGNNTFTGTTKFDNDVNIHGANLEVAGMLEAATGNITNLQVPNTLTSSGEINAVSIKTTGLRSDDIQTTTNKKYLTEVDVDNQTIQMVDDKLHANLDTKQDILADGNGTKVVDNKVDIYQGDAGIRGLNLYQNNGTVTKDNDLNTTFNNGACGYIFLENKGANNDYEIILHQSYLGTHGSESDSSINGVRCLPQDVVPTPGEGAQGECWFDTYESPFRVVAIPNGGSVQTRTVDTINYIKYVIKGTNLTISYSSTGDNYTELYTIAISSTYVINVCIANSPWQNDINNKWTNTTLHSDSYVLDKTTNTYLMKLGVTSEGVAVATSTKYGLVLPDNSTIVSNNGVISANLPDTSKFLDKTVYSNQQMRGSLTVNGGVTECKKFRIRSSSTGSIDYANPTSDKIMFIFRGVNGDYPILIGDSTQNMQIDSTKVLFNSPTLARKVNDSTEATIIDSNNISEYIPQSGGITIKDTFVDGTSGYRIWTDGYCEQWGLLGSVTSNAQIQLLKSFVDTSYGVLIDCNSTDDINTVYMAVKLKTVDKFNVALSRPVEGLYWRAFGYIK